MPSREQVRAWREMADKATPGPWSVYDDLTGWESYEYDPRLLFDCGAVGILGPDTDYADWPDVEQDLPHVAASRESVPAMADMLERAAALMTNNSRDADAWLREWNGEEPQRAE